MKFRLVESFTDLHSIVNNIYDYYLKYDDNGSNQNCLLCTWAVELQLRGYEFLPRPVYSPDDIIFKAVKGYGIINHPEKLTFSNKEDLIDIIDSYPDSRWYCHVNWENSSGGHEFLIINDDNIKIVDAQDNKIIPIYSDKDYLEGINYSNSFIVRLDNKAINKDVLKYNDMKYAIPFDRSIDESLITKIKRRDNENDFSPFGYQVDFYDEDNHIGTASVCGIKDNNAFLYDLEVFPEYRGKGYGNDMTKFMIDKYDIKQLYVRKDNTKAINLYKKFDFEITDDANDDEYLMER